MTTPREHGGADRDRGATIGVGVAWAARWSLRVLLVAGVGWVLWQLLGWLWVVVLPIFLALIVSSVLMPLAAWLRRHKVPSALAAAVVLLGSVGALVGLFVVLAPPVIGQLEQIAANASSGLQKVQSWLSGPPLNLRDQQVSSAVDQITSRLQDSASAIASGVLSGVFVVTSALVTLILVLVLTFFFLKDGPKFRPFVRRVVGQRVGVHVDAVLWRAWAALGEFFRLQAMVGLIDAVLIGAGLLVLSVPLALPLTVLTFFGAFIPIVGAFAIGALAVLVALVTKGVTTALIVLAIIVVVQQLEGNVLQPLLQGRGLSLHPAVVLLAVAAGGTLFGIAGAFFAVPFVAVVAGVLRYLLLNLDEQASEADAAPREPDERDDAADGLDPSRPEDDTGAASGTGDDDTDDGGHGGERESAGTGGRAATGASRSGG